MWLLSLAFAYPQPTKLEPNISENKLHNNWTKLDKDTGRNWTNGFMMVYRLNTFSFVIPFGKNNDRGELYGTN